MPEDRSALLALLNSLAKPLAEETKLRNTNAAMEGGTDAHVLSLIERALAALENGALAPECEFPLQRLQDLWSRYSDADINERQHVLDATQRLLIHLRAADLRGSATNESEAESALQVLAGDLTRIGAPVVDDEDEIINEETIEMDAAQDANEAGGDWERKPSFRDFQKQREPDSVEEEKPKKKKPAKAKKPRAPLIPTEDLDADLMYLKGVGPKRAQQLGKLGLRTVRDLLYHFPARYEDRRNAKTIDQLVVGEKESVLVTVLYAPQTNAMSGRMSGRTITRVRVGDDTGRLDLSWWNQPWREKQFPVGTQIFVYGKVTEFNGALQIDAPDFEIVSDQEDESSNVLQVGRIVPVYPSTEGLLQPHLRRAIKSALDKFAPQLDEMLPPQVLAEHDLSPLEWSLRQIHFPDNWDDKENARYRLVFEELFLLQIALAQKKLRARGEVAGIRHDIEDEKIKAWLKQLPFGLTGAQKRVMNEVRKDLKSGRPMNRLLHGDVGSGKTIVAAYALWSAQQSGHQGALLAPTQILAEQHFTTLTRLFKTVGH